jgi:hypothetical protein
VAGLRGSREDRHANPDPRLPAVRVTTAYDCQARAALARCSGPFRPARGSPFGDGDDLDRDGVGAPCSRRKQFVHRDGLGVGAARPAVGCCLAGWPPWQANGPPGLSCLETAKSQPDPRVGRISVARRSAGKTSPSSRVTSHRFRGRRSQLPCFAASASKFS